MDGFPNTEFHIPLNERKKFIYSPQPPPSAGMETWIIKDLVPVITDFSQMWLDPVILGQRYQQLYIC